MPTLRCGRSLAHPIVKLLLLGLIWAYLHHFCAGIRFLLLDLHIGTELTAARQSSLRRAGRQPRADRDHRSAALVTRVIVGAHYGLEDWLAQRVTAVVMALYTLLLLGIALYQGGIDYASWTALFAHPALRIATLLFAWRCSGTPGSACATSGWTTSSRRACGWRWKC